MTSPSSSGTPLLRVNSERVRYLPGEIHASYDYHYTRALQGPNGLELVPASTAFEFRTSTRIPRLGVLLVGWGGNNGSTLTAGILANRLGLEWKTKSGIKSANYFGSLTQSSTVKVGVFEDGTDCNVPLKDVLPTVHPNDLVIGGWDINGSNLAQAMARAQVLDYNLQEQLDKHLETMVPLPSIYYPDFIAANQKDRADNLISGSCACWEHVERIQQDIKNFKLQHGLDSVIVLWTANTERYSDLIEGVNDTAENLLHSIRTGHDEVSPSSVFAVASILSGCSYINGSPQNTFVPGVIELAMQHGVFIGGDDFKTGQTKLKSVLVDFLVSAGIKVQSIVSYNHLGNNDGKNLSAPKQFRSKEISKSTVVDDMVAANHILYGKGEHPDHCVVIKYVPYVGDSKRALDEYTSEIFLGGTNTIVLHNTCEDSLLAAPLILDLIILTELMQRIEYKTPDASNYEHFDPVLSVLSYLLKAPLVRPGTPVVNALFKQRACIENILRACIGLPPENSMLLEHKTAISLK